MMSNLSANSFPSLSGTVVCRWAPILLSPILDSPERLVIGVATVSAQGFHIERANALNRLQCLFGKAAETAIFAADVAFDELEATLAEKGPAALQERALVFSGVTLGAVREGEGASLRAVAQTWMGALSSLYVFVPTEAETVATEAAEESPTATGSDRLPLLVLDDVIARDPRYAGYFSEDIRLRRQRRSRVAGIGIDYSSPTLVANFATLGPSAHAKSVDIIKRKLFDLIMRRDDNQTSLLGPQSHEMIVYSPGMSDPLVSEKQRGDLDEVHDELGEQSKREDITFFPVTDVGVIGRHIVQAAGHA